MHHEMLAFLQYSILTKKQQLFFIMYFTNKAY